jgi:hypothetical protein
MMVHMARANESQPVFRVLLRAQPGEIPATIRLKRFLKLALRAFGLRCVSCEEIQANPGTTQPGQASFGHQGSLREQR